MSSLRLKVNEGYSKDGRDSNEGVRELVLQYFAVSSWRIFLSFEGQGNLALLGLGSVFWTFSVMWKRYCSISDGCLTWRKTDATFARRQKNISSVTIWFGQAIWKVDTQLHQSWEKHAKQDVERWATCFHSAINPMPHLWAFLSLRWWLLEQNRMRAARKLVLINR